MNSFAKGMLAGTGVLLLVVVAAGAGLAAFGMFNVGADEPPGTFAEMFFPSARDRSIAARAADITVPKLDDPQMVAEGAEHYAPMCAMCHLAPGMADTDLRKGLHPQPPVLATLALRPAGEQFWIVKHGIQMTGMPAWGATHSDGDIWKMVAFLQKLPGMTPEQYRALTVGRGGQDHRVQDQGPQTDGDDHPH